MVFSRSQLNGCLASVRKVNRVNIAGISETIVFVIHQFIVRVRLPPVKAGEKLDDVTVTNEQGLGIVAPAVHPPAARIGPDVGSTASALPGCLIAAGHVDVPRRSAQNLC